jgi:hypothetical protein
LPYAKGGVRVW